LLALRREARGLENTTHGIVQLRFETRVAPEPTGDQPSDGRVRCLGVKAETRAPDGASEAAAAGSPGVKIGAVQANHPDIRLLILRQSGSTERTIGERGLVQDPSILQDGAK
jgi:hypothetical protein